MTTFSRLRIYKSLFFLLCLTIAAIHAQGQGTSQPEQKMFEPEVEVQKEDYAKARKNFQTALVRKDAAPQKWDPVTVPADVTELVYKSDALFLKAWVSQPKNREVKGPAVLFLHGGFSFGEPDWKMAQPYIDAGYVVMTPILRGENGQAGSFSMFYDEIDDILAAAKLLRSLPYVDRKRIYIAGHSAGGTMALLAAESSKYFRAAASFDASPDQQLLFGATGSARRSWIPKEVVFDHHILRELQVRSPLAYVTSLHCPVRLYYSTEAMSLYQKSTIRTADLAKQNGLDAEAIKISGSHFSHVPAAMQQSIEFFRAVEAKAAKK